MKLRQIFEGLGQEVAIIFGRFNPPHKGHRAAWELAAKSPVWYVGTNESTVGPKDPLPYGIKVEAMTAIWPEVEGHIIAETSWLTLASLVYEKHGDVTLLCLTDEDWVTKTIVQYNGKEGAHGFYNFKNIKQIKSSFFYYKKRPVHQIMRLDEQVFFKNYAFNLLSIGLKLSRHFLLFLNNGTIIFNRL